MKFFAKLKKQTHGQSLVELAISLMIIMLLVLGAVETGMAIFQYVTISDAAQEGANYASVHPGGDSSSNASEIQNRNDTQKRVIATASDVVQLTASNIFIKVNGAACEGSTGGVPNSIEVKVEFDHKIIFPLYPGSAPIKLRAQATNTILSPMCP
jgi:Flp pilus assembly protein TadG